ncbi:MAG: UvrD-helicase domain-containing protein [Bacteroidales bacterium]|nr:UvrD-helicase domain-containing protein [Bacteroidales bacterium]
MNKLSVIKASAGSGKTYTLTWSILHLLFNHKAPDYFKHILAVTFTNKATEEMKSRFISELGKLAGGEHSEYHSRLKGFGHKDEEIRERASQILRHILHEYSWFSIETIDSFFQRVIRSFTRELGLPGNYHIELDTDLILEYAVDQLIDSVGEDEQLFDWLLSFAEEKIEEGKTWDFRNDLLDLGKELFKEHFSTHAKQLMELFRDRERMKSFRDEMLKVKLSFEKKCMAIGAEGLRLIDQHGLTEQDFFSKKNGAAKIFRMLSVPNLWNSKDELFTSLKIMDALLEGPEKWPAADSPAKEQVVKLAEISLLPMLKEAVSVVESGLIPYETARTMLRNLYALGILVDLSEKIRDYRLDKNTFILSEFAILIDRIINHNDTPFIYEKMGNRYHHFLIDEFQDTSRLQWKNFKPLISNSLSQNARCVLVGDAKQSIYRWRNGEWEILARQLFEEFPEEALSVVTLKTNWRSRENIVKFNSEVFQQAVEILRRELDARIDPRQFSLEGGTGLLNAVYDDVAQAVPEKNAGEKRGNILLRFFSGKEIRGDRNYFYPALTQAINDLLRLKYQPGEIAIIVRDRNQGERIVMYLNESNQEGRFDQPLDFISEESLLISSSVAVNLLIAAMKYLMFPGENLYRAELLGALAMLGEKEPSGGVSWLMYLQDTESGPVAVPKGFSRQIQALKSLPLYEMIESLILIFKLDQLHSDTAYIHAFLNLVYDFSQQEQASVQGLLDFWDQRGRKKSIPASSGQDAIRILTIHKSKGLEYGAVILPFCDWGFNQKANQIFWVDMPEELKAEAPVFPINYSSGLRYTYFAEAYNHELFRSFVDNLNLLYVAMTRAKESLIAFPVYKDEGIKSVGDLLYQTLESAEGGFLASGYVPENKEFRIGFDIPHIPETGASDGEPAEYIRPVGGSMAMERLFFARDTLEYFSEKYSAITEGKIRGQVLHELLAGMTTLNDLEPALSFAVKEGDLSVVQAGELEKHIRFCASTEPANSWFNGSGQVISEADIILPGGQVRRPDRIVILGEEVHVIDYKFGSDKDDPRHRRQVRSYMELLLNMGYKQLKGFLWYIDRNELVQVNNGEGA